MKVGIHVVATNDLGQVLLVKKGYQDKDWGPPGGMMEDNESILETAKREFLEETGYHVQPEELVAVSSLSKTLVLRPQTMSIKNSLGRDPSVPT